MEYENTVRFIYCAPVSTPSSMIKMVCNELSAKIFNWRVNKDIDGEKDKENEFLIDG